MDFDTLVLGGGGIKCIAMLGALQYMYDNGATHIFKKYIGTSAGAMICFFLAIGYTPVELIACICTREILESLLPVDVVSLVTGHGAISYTKLETHLRSMVMNKIGREKITLKELAEEYGITLVCTTYNMTKNICEYLSQKTYPEMDCLTAVRMSSAIPIVFDECEYDGCIYLDGGIVDNFSITVPQPEDKVFGCVMFTEYKKLGEQNRILSLLRVLVTVSSNFYIDRILQNYPHHRILRLNVENIDLFEFKQTRARLLDMFSSGYNNCQLFFNSSKDK